MQFKSLEDWENGWMHEQGHMDGFNGIVDFIEEEEQMMIKDRLIDG